MKKKYIYNVYDDGQLISLVYKHKLIRKMLVEN